MIAQGISAFGQDAQRLEAKPGSPVRAADAPNLRPVKDILHDLMDAFDRLSDKVENSLTDRDQMDARWNANRERRYV